MPGTFGAGPLLSPWVGAWDLVWQSPESWLVLASALIGLTLAGAALTVLGRGGNGQQAQTGAPAVAVVRSKQQARPSRRNRRHRAA